MGLALVLKYATGYAIIPLLQGVLMSYKSRVKNLIAELEKDLFEREECVRLVLLAMFAGKAIFLYGPPGTAKSMIARKVSLAFGEPKDFFSALMHRFSTPEDIFGPIDIG